MKYSEILNTVDHTILNPTAVWEDVQKVLDEAVEFSTASACIAPSFVPRAKEYLGGRARICTVVGFPLGYSTTYVKVFEAMNAVQNGADEIDMVVNLSDVKQGEFMRVATEIANVKKAVGDHVLKVIVETCLLNLQEKIALCKAVADGGAQYIKTSTGFSSGGATRDDVRLLKAYVPAGLKIKASGGIATIEDAVDFLELGADRLGTSRLVALVKERRAMEE